MPKVSDLFDVLPGHSLELNRLTQTDESEGVAFISRKMRDNGIVAYVRRIPALDPAPAGELTCALSGNGVLSTFVQEQPFYTAFHVARLRPKFALSISQLLYFCMCIKANRYRFSYGRQANRTLKDLDVPDPRKAPEWVDAAFKGVFASWHGLLNRMLDAQGGIPYKT
jgi:hypothetical protein